MIRSKKIRNVLHPPKILYFSPHGILLKDSNDVILTVDEYEAIRLAGYKKLKQKTAAKRMNVSRPTFTRIVESARKKIAEALTMGKTIRIEGGNFIFLKNRIRCIDCSNVWEIEGMPRINLHCPSCGGINLEDIGNKFYGRCQKRRWRGES